MSLPEEQQKDIRSSLNPIEAQTEKLETEVELEFEEELNNGGELNSEEKLSIEEKLAIEEELRIKAAEQERRLNEITYLNATTSPLLLLPAELRNMIFEYAMYHETINLHLKCNERTGLAMRTPEPRHSEPLLFVSRQITSEVALLPYKLNVFSINFHRYADLGDFLNKRTPDQLDLMVKVMCKLCNHGHQVHVASAAKWMAFLKEMLRKEA